MSILLIIYYWFCDVDKFDVAPDFSLFKIYKVIGH